VFIDCYFFSVFFSSKVGHQSQSKPLSSLAHGATAGARPADASCERPMREYDFRGKSGDHSHLPGLLRISALRGDQGVTQKLTVL
jgi:hypothetical protein